MRCVRDHMSIYETRVRETAKALQEESKLDFERMREDISGAWCVLVESGFSQDEIWTRLTAWIDQHTNIDDYACGVVVSFLTQICEVFSPRRSILIRTEDLIDALTLLLTLGVLDLDASKGVASRAH